MSTPAPAPSVTWQGVTGSPGETQRLAAALAAVARPGDRLALVGPLGAGKTQFAKGFARGLGVRDVVNSPSFTLMAEYEGRLPLFHQDLYRLSGTAEALADGLLDERQDDGVTLSEWADRLDAVLDPGRLTVAIEPLEEDRRSVSLRGDGVTARRYLEAARRWEADGPRETHGPREADGPREGGR
jgi:tRNA threonylcarbamoyladenosine biosynthesis protein TsaE